MKKSILVLFTMTFALAAFASADGSLSLSPAVVMLRGDYGQSTTQTLTFTNGTSRAFEFDLVAQDVVAQNGKRVFVDAGNIAGSIAATAVFSRKHVQVLPGETTAVTLTVTLPPATRQRAIVALFRGTNRVMSGRVPMSASLGMLLTFTVSDDVQLDAAPLEVRPQSATVNLGFSQKCTNSGREPFVAKGVMAVLDANGKLVGRSALEPHRFVPGESADLAGEYGGELDPGRYRVFVTYDFEGHSVSRSSDVEIR